MLYVQLGDARNYRDEILELFRQNGRDLSQKSFDYGVSCSRIEDAALCFRYPGIAAIQIEMNLSQISAAESVVPAAAVRDIAVIAREPFAGGAFFIELEDCNKRGKNHFSVQSPLRTVLGVSGVCVVIPGMSSRQHLRENLRALDYEHAT